MARRPTLDALEPRRLMAVTATPLPALYAHAGPAPVHDATGRTWLAGDASFSGGSDVSVPSDTPIDAPLAAPTITEPASLQTARVGSDFTFSANVPQGDYELFLEFADLDPASAAGTNVFSVSANGSPIASNVDVVARAGASRTATAVVSDLQIDATDTLSLHFAASAGHAFVNAVALVPLDVPAAAAPYDIGNANSAADPMLLPTLSGSNLVATGHAIQLYADDHRGNYPARPSDAFREYQGLISVLADPRTTTLAPRAVLSPLEAIAWADHLDDYVYLGAGKTDRTIGKAAATTVVAYENPTSVAGDLNVLYADGHVTFVPRAEAAADLGFDADLEPTRPAPVPFGLPRDANIVASWLNVHAIVSAIERFAFAHSARQPLDLGTLLRGNYGLSLADFVDTRRGNAAPIASDTWTTDEKVAWVNANSDYVLVGASKSLSSLTTLLYERPTGLDSVIVADSSGAVNVLEPRYAFERLAIDNGPIVLDTAFDAGGREPTVRVRFSEFAATAEPSGTVVRRGDGSTFAPTAVSFDDHTNTASFTLPFAAMTGQHYTFTLPAADAIDASGKPLTSDATLAFSFLAGDVNADGAVNFSDLLILARHYGTSDRSAMQGNVDYDVSGNVDIADLIMLARHYGDVIASPAAVPAGTTTPVSSRRPHVALVEMA